MSFNKLHIFIGIGIGLISSFSYAQKPVSDEEKNLIFQNYFFEALKDNAVDNYSKAIESLENCYVIDSTSLAVEFELSKNYLMLKKYFEAELFIDKALKKEPENVNLLGHKVSILKSQSNFNEAIEIQKKIIEKKPVYSDRLVLLYIQNGDFESAEKLIETIEEKVLVTMKVKKYKAFLMNKKAIKNNPIVTEKATTENSSLEDLKYLFKNKKEFTVLLEILKYEVENMLFEQLTVDSTNGLEYFPAQPLLYQLNGFALNKQGRFDDAIDVLTIGIDFVIDNVQLEMDFYNQLVISYQGLGNEKEALKYKQKAESLKQTH